MSHRLPVTARIGLDIAAPQRVAPLSGPRFLVGDRVRVPSGNRGVVVEVFDHERRVQLAVGRTEWHRADALVRSR